jgi:FMN phosphatase YigB (HAD superfamily)
VVFDLYGTLVNHAEPIPTVELLTSVLQPFAALPLVSPETIAGDLLAAFGHFIFDPTVVQPSTEAVIDTVLARHGVHLAPAEIDDLLRRVLVDASATPYEAVDGAAAVLERVHRAGCTIRLLSNCVLPRRHLEAVLDGLGLLAFFDQLVLSSEGQVRKPSPDAFAMAGRGRFRRRLMVGNTPAVDLEPARSLGWEVVHYQGAMVDWDRVYAFVGGG